MRDIKPIFGSYFTLAVIYLAGVVFFFRPIAERDTIGAQLVPPLIGFLVSTSLYITLFVWIAKRMRSGLRAGLALALSQLLLVNVDYVLTGDRGLATAAASSLLLIVAWSTTGWVYDRLSGAKV